MTSTPRTPDEVEGLKDDLADYRGQAAGSAGDHPSVVEAAVTAAVATAEKIHDETGNAADAADVTPDRPR